MAVEKYSSGVDTESQFTSAAFSSRLETSNDIFVLVIELVRGTTERVWYDHGWSQSENIFCCAQKLTQDGETKPKSFKYRDTLRATSKH